MSTTPDMTKEFQKELKALGLQHKAAKRALDKLVNTTVAKRNRLQRELTRKLKAIERRAKAESAALRKDALRQDCAIFREFNALNHSGDRSLKAISDRITVLMGRIAS